MLHFCTVNKRIMETARKDRAYVTLLIDLVNAGAVTKAKAEALLGYTLPDHLETVVMIQATTTVMMMMIQAQQETSHEYLL